ncbi:unnamed protein product [Clonostachys chloroleuca]|uniref:Uncharacterized protein n=1 Tax=Clonostachys chloroleuca TaxID=1926264 RepID=A0AA35MA22_9HYPO|nr:unnamed protein product [Clonostachys chloroleuca]
MRLLRMLGGELRVPDDGLCAKARDVITGRAPVRTLGQHKRASKLPTGRVDGVGASRATEPRHPVARIEWLVAAIVIVRECFRALEEEVPNPLNA